MILERIDGPKDLDAKKSQPHYVSSPRGAGKMGRHFLTRRQKWMIILKLVDKDDGIRDPRYLRSCGRISPSLTMWSLLLENRCFIHCSSYLKAMAAQRRTLAVGAGGGLEISCPALPSPSASLGLWEGVKKEENNWALAFVGKACWSSFWGVSY